MINIEQYLKSHEQKEMVRFITCGSVDDGKSTLIGRLLYDSKSIYEDQLSSIVKDSKKYGTTGEKVDLALLVDGLQSEREQGITIDVAYRFFSTDKRKFIIADTPGHEQYTRNMVTGASTADVAIILIDARYGVQNQTKRHSYIASLLGIKHIIVAINKMDLVQFSQERFLEIKNEYEKLIVKFPHHHSIDFTYIPISALNGDNIVSLSSLINWYEGQSLLDILNTLPLQKRTSENNDFRMMVQYVNRPHLNFRGFCGTIASGTICEGDEVTVYPSCKSSKIKQIILPQITTNDFISGAQKAITSMSITVTLEDEIDISRGDLIAKKSDFVSMTKSFSAMIVWMDERKMVLGQSYIIKRGTTVINGSFEQILYKKEINTFQEEAATSLELNDIAKCTLILDKEIAFDTYEKNRFTGSFIIIDKLSNNTVGAGMILSSIVYTQSTVINRIYTQKDIELNAFIRANYPEWHCKEIL